MSAPELLLDIVYRGTFKKPRDPALRAKLTQARRIVLSDAMAGYLIDLRLNTILPHGGYTTFKQSHGRLDDCRYFAEGAAGSERRITTSGNPADDRAGVPVCTLQDRLRP
jgi:hypothetical protein